MSTPRIFSGIQPSGNLHIGNHIGALKQWVAHQDQSETYFCVVDLHAITVPQDPEVLKVKIREITAWYLAAGIDPEKSVIFIQSQNPDHAQLGWILNCFTSIGQMNRMTQYKEKKEKQEFVSVGLFDYPVLMAADILLYDTNSVPVGEDQKQHVELARDVAERFNDKFGETFVLPAYTPPPTGARIMSLQHPNEKMSKSGNDILGTIYLADNADTVRDKVKRAVTDSGDDLTLDKSRPAIANLTTVFMALSGKSLDELKSIYDGQGYKKFKDDLAELAVATLSPLQEKFAQITKSGSIDKILTAGTVRARSISTPKVTQVMAKLGLG